MYEVRTRMFENTTNNVIGIASFVVDGRFAFNGIRVISSDNAERGFFLAMPSYKVGDSRYVDYFHPISSEMVQSLANAVERSMGEDITVRIGKEETGISYNVELTDNGKQKAKVTMKIGNDFVCDSISIMEGSKGLFISMPSYKNKNDEYKNYCNPITKEFKEQMDQDIMDTFNALVTVRENIEKRHATAHQVDYSVNEQAQSKVAEKTVGGTEFMEIGDDDDCPLKDLTDDEKEIMEGKNQAKGKGKSKSGTKKDTTKTDEAKEEDVPKSGKSR